MALPLLYEIANLIILDLWREMLPKGWDDAMLDTMLAESLAFLKKTFD